MDNRANFFRTKFKTKRVEIIKFWFRYDATTKTNLQAVHAIFCTNIVNLVLAHPVYLYLSLPQSHLLKTVHILLAWFDPFKFLYRTELFYMLGLHICSLAQPVKKLFLYSQSRLACLEFCLHFASPDLCSLLP